MMTYFSLLFFRSENVFLRIQMMEFIYKKCLNVFFFNEAFLYFPWQFEIITVYYLLKQFSTFNFN